MAFISTIQAPSFRHSIAFVSLLGIIIGLFVSKAMISIGVVLIGLQFFITPDIQRSFKRFYTSKILLFVSFLFCIYLFSSIYSENTTRAWSHLSMKLPFILMPLGFSALYDFPKRHFKTLLYFFILFTCITSLSSLWVYLSNFNEITESYKHAKVIPNAFGISHTRLSLMVAISIFSSIFLFKEKYYFISKKEHYFILSIGVINFIFLHVLSVRSGLLAFYLSALFIALVYTIQKKKYFLGIIALILISSLPILAYFMVPTIKNKIEYMTVDVTRFLNGESVSHYSDGNRLLSMQIGIKIGMLHPILGTGVGDIRDDMFQDYAINHPDIAPEVRLTPHNQFIYVFAACGIVGLLLFLIASLSPFILKESYSNWFFLSIYVILMSSFLSEATVENQLGTTIFILFYLMSWQLKPTIANPE